MNRKTVEQMAWCRLYIELHPVKIPKVDPQVISNNLKRYEELIEEETKNELWLDSIGAHIDAGMKKLTKGVQ